MIELPSVSVERGEAMAERDRLQPGEPVSAAGAAEQNRQLVAHQPAAEAGENRRPNDQARSLLLAAVGREPSDAPPLRVDGTADRVAAPASRIGQPPPPSGTSATKGRGEGKVSETSVKRGPVSGLGRIRRGDTDLFGGAFTIRTGYGLYSGRSGGTVSVGPEPIMEIPVKSVGSGSGSK